MPRRFQVNLLRMNAFGHILKDERGQRAVGMQILVLIRNGHEIEAEKTVFRIENLDFTPGGRRDSGGFVQELPPWKHFEEGGDFLSHILLRDAKHRLAGGVDKLDGEVAVNDDDAFADGIEDALQKALVIDEAKQIGLEARVV